MNNKNVIIVGLIKGRHELPVTNYIFEVIEDVTDFKTMESVINNFVTTTVGIKRTYGCGINQIGYEDVEVLAGQKELIVYVTGLTAATATLIKVCAFNGISLTLMHYNAVEQNYIPQRIF